MPPRRVEPNPAIAGVLLCAVGIVVAWWGWKQGAYFGPVFYPGAIGLFLLAALFLLFVPLSLRFEGPPLVALVGLGGLAAWTLLSWLWTPAPASAIAYGERVFAYLTLFVFGVWATRLLGERLRFSLLPIAVAGALVGIATTIVIATGTNVTWYLHEDATLRFPIGYRNGNAALFLICLWPLLGLASRNQLRWPWRALAVAMGTMAIELALLSQSRGSLPALALALLVFIVLSPRRLRFAGLTALAALPAALAAPTLVRVFQYGNDTPGVIPLLHHAGQAVIFTTFVSFVLAALVLSLLYPRLRLGPSGVRTLSWSTAIVAIVAVLLGGGIFVARHGGPVGFVDQRINQFGKTGYPNLSRQSVRFGANIGSNRHDFWRVSVDEGIAHPLLGAGAGSFQQAYLLHKRSDESPHDPHSIEALAFGELGFPGLLLLALFVGGSIWGVVRARRNGSTETAIVVAAAAAGGTQWFVHSSYDWFWQYPGVTGPGVFLIGVAIAPGLVAASTGVRWVRWLVGAGAIALALGAAPLFLSDRYSDRAAGEAEADPVAAIQDFDRAAKLNPLSDLPLLGKGTVSASLGERPVALQAYRQAIGRVPHDYAPYYLLAQELWPQSPRAARVALAKARSLNPRGSEVVELAQRFASEAKKVEG
jgi:O-antigen ligase/polysaccharide polymerase Wzy-like membrane protein